MMAATTLARNLRGGKQMLLPNRKSGISVVRQRRMGDAELKPCSDSSLQTVTDNSAGGGVLRKQCSDGGFGSQCAEYVFTHWVEMGAT